MTIATSSLGQLAMPDQGTDPSSQTIDRESLMESVRTVVVKVGTNVLTRESGEMALGRIHSIIEDLADLKKEGRRMILVSSGAISMGIHRLNRQRRPAFLSDKQAYAAVGQIRLMAVYQQALENFDIPTAQILLTEDDFRNRTRYLNLRNTMSRLLDLDVLPVVNENDSISTSEIEESGPATPGHGTIFGDNDVLSALVSAKLGVDLLLLLSDVDGLYPEGPPPSGTCSSEARPLSVVRKITEEIRAMAREGSARGRGGMASKLQAVRIAVQSGSRAVIANGTRQGTIRDVLAGKDTGTLFLPNRRLASRKRWIAFASPVAGRVVVNRGARDALLHGRTSLLFAGVVRLEEEFNRGDVLSVLDPQGREFARGITNYGSKEALPLVGKRSDEITRLVGRNYEELINRHNLAIWD